MRRRKDASRRREIIVDLRWDEGAHGETEEALRELPGVGPPILEVVHVTRNGRGEVGRIIDKQRKEKP